MSSVILEAHDLTKEYRHTVALDHIDLKIEKGKIYGFIGQNGAGKTTNRMAYIIVSVKLSMVIKILSEVFTITHSFTSLGSDFCNLGNCSIDRKSVV